MQSKPNGMVTLLSAAALTLLTPPVTLAADTAPATAAKPAYDNMIGLTTADGKLVYDFINLWFNEKKGAEAFDKYVSHDNYLNHAVYNSSVNKPRTFEQEKEEEARIVPANGRFVFKQLIAQGGLVFAHINAFPDARGGPGDEMVMILRVQNGKITDHWDLHTELQEDSAVFAGLDRLPGQKPAMVKTTSATADAGAARGNQNGGAAPDPAQMFKSADKNADGKLDMDEFMATMAGMGGGQRGGAPGGAPGAGSPPPAASPK